ncbi:unnamed protein product [Kluyveromyces dobzhanskii CBS 2104]|uniref:WGS project CCBQ000000000 data, contig 00107 n=1 Tax=Kluyveromyces dobzhanskii CBS 2104 TaxID=1427455 RepID=A0A0A8KZ40_9SACH|nr:unnamed protein product [Kluyveromyces dobzhanskii CBS 2104]
MDERNTFGTTFYSSVAKHYCCQCRSCQIGPNVEFYMIRFFIVGFIVPVLWIINVSLYVYANWITEHTISPPEVDAETIYTDYECQQWKQRSVTSLKHSISEEFYTINNPFTFSMVNLKPSEPLSLSTYQPSPSSIGKPKFSETTASSAQETCVASSLKQNADSAFNDVDDGRSLVTLQCLKEIASQVSKNHGINARNIRNWCLRSVCAMVGYTISIVMLVVVVRTHRNQLLYDFQ